MPSYLNGPGNQSNEPVPVLPVELGGTGSRTAEGALANFGAVSRIEINRQDGPISLLNGIIPLEKMPDSVLSKLLAIDGPRILSINTEGTYQITNYNSFTNYVISCENGSIRRTDDEIIYTAPASPGLGIFHVNNKKYQITITGAGIVLPTIVTPIDKATNQVSDVTITSSAFSVQNGTDTHLNSSWQLASDSSFTNIIEELSHSVSNKTTWLVTNLSENTEYYVRVKFTGTTFGDTAWSSITAFKTRKIFAASLEIGEITPSVSYPDNWFGWSIDISKDNSTIAISAPHATSTERGLVYVYRNNEGALTLEQEISISPAIAYEWFGMKVALSANGDTLAISAIGNSVPGSIAPINNGAVYIYVRSGTTWAKQTKLIIPDANSYDWFGNSIRLSDDGNKILIGAVGHDVANTTDAGSIYIFTRIQNIWTYTAGAYASDLFESMLFGTCVTMTPTGNRLAASTNPGYTAYGIHGGAVYTYTMNGNTLAFDKKITSTDGSSLDLFGFCTVMSEDGLTLCISAPKNTNQIGSSVGSVYVYEYVGNNWTMTAKIMPPDGKTDDFFGNLLSLTSDGLHLYIASRDNDNEKGINAGAIYIFEKIDNVWSFRKKLIPAALTTGGYFGEGMKVSADGKYLLAAAVGGNTQVTNSGWHGRVWIFN